MFKIPQQFMLGGLTIQVEFLDTLLKDRQIYGEACYKDQKILLDSTVSPELLVQNFFHELMHWIFYVMNEETLRNDEKICDLISHFMTQVFGPHA